ncbi:hypothetical protein ACE400_29565, partial [Salmonella enterica]|uniref:hypothetical protein n=1 Tax=Salmonella enterica TaxID=28901 RepID=UPI003D2D0C5B
MNILLVKLPTLLAPKSFSYFGSVPPLGLAYIAGILKQDGHRISTLDAAAEGINLFRVFEPNPRLL